MAKNKLIIYLRGIFQIIVILSTAFFLTSSGKTIHSEEIQSFIDSPQGKFITFQDAVNNSYDGDTLNVYGGKYSGPISVDKTLTIIGHNWPVLDGGNLGTVIALKAPNIILKGFLIVNSGKVLDQENSGLAVESTGIIIEGNRFENTLFGIYLRQASNSVIRNNIIHTKNLPPPRRGDPIRIWFSNDVLVENNQVEKGRDVVLWYSERLVVRGNNISGGRYGLHFMYCDDAIVEANRLTNNSVGAFLMYSRNLRLKNNFISGNRGPSGYGIGIKDMDNGVIRDNLFVDNRIGVAVDNSPRQIDGFMIFEGNIFSFNDIGVRLTPSVHSNQFTSNSFIDNQEQVSIAGGGQLQGNYWTVDGVGNYWSDYAGYDANQNGVGDIPYKAEKLFENLMDRYPELRLFLYSPASQSVDFAARALPMIKPRTKLVDHAPLMDIKFPENFPIKTKNLPSNDIGIVSVGLLVALLALFSVPGLSIRHKLKNKKTDDLDDLPLLKIEKLTKRFKAIKVVNKFNLKIAAGESVAMWGSNGAGKTTIIRCILGLLEYEGSIKVNGLDLKHHGKSIRKLVGYVPQKLELHEDMSVVNTMIFYSHLKKADQKTIPKLLKDMNLIEHSEKLVKQLSGGMKQRLGLALALLSDPPILILDEPTANLDTYTRQSILLQISKLKKNGKTLIFASHRTSDILNLADRVLVLENGQIIDECHPAQIKLQNTSKVTMFIYLLENQLEKASSLLQNQGFKINCRDSNISVSILPEEAITLLSILIKGEINITDFDLKKAE